MTLSQCMQGESNGGGISRVAFRAYVNRYYSGSACQDVGPFVGSGEQSSVLCLSCSKAGPNALLITDAREQSWEAVFSHCCASHTPMEDAALNALLTTRMPRGLLEYAHKFCYDAVTSLVFLTQPMPSLGATVTSVLVCIALRT